MADRDLIDSKQIKNGPVALRKEPSPDAKVLCLLPDGAIVSFEDDTGGTGYEKVRAWDEESEKSYTGYIPEGQYESIGTDLRNFRAQGEVISRTISLRVGPDVEARKLATLQHGETFTFARKEGDYIFVHYDGGKDGTSHEGYLRADLVVYPARHIVLNSGGVPAYAYPSLDAKQVSELSAGTRLTVIEELEDFWVVSLRTAAACIAKNDNVDLE